MTVHCSVATPALKSRPMAGTATRMALAPSEATAEASTVAARSAVPVALRRAGSGLSSALEWSSVDVKFGRMHSDDDQPLTAVLVCPCPDVRQRAQPIDTRIGPELDDHGLLAQVCRRERRGVQPSGCGIERRHGAFQRQRRT